MLKEDVCAYIVICILQWHCDPLHMPMILWESEMQSYAACFYVRARKFS